MVPRRLLALLAAAVALCVAPATAAGARPGALVQLTGGAGCLVDNWDVQDSGCPRVMGLYNVMSATTSPDGRFLYATGLYELAGNRVHGGTITTFARDPETGALSQLPGAAGCVRAPRTKPIVPARCPGAARGIAGALTIALSPDGRNAYVASISSDAIAVFSRDPDTGALTQLPGAEGCIQDRAGTPRECSTLGRGLHGSRYVTVSPDGRNVYSASPASDTITVFARNRQTGALRQLGCIEDTAPQRSGTCAQVARGLNYPRMVSISPDGRNAYVASDIADSDWPGDPADGSDVAVFSRDPSDGRLTQLPGDEGCIKDRQAPVTNRCTAVGNGLKGAFGATVSPDGRNVYVAADDHGTIASFSRDPGTGALTQLPGAASCMKDAVRGDGSCPTTAMGIAGANLVTISPDGAYAYVAGFDALAVASFARDRATGALTPLGCVEDVRAGPRARCGAKGPGIFNPRVVVLSPDGRFGYVPASAGNAIAIFSTGTSTRRR